MERPKARRVVSDVYRRFVRRHDCVVHLWRCPQQPERDPAHVRSKGSGGSDLCCVPLCRPLHRELDSTPHEEFEEKYGVNLWYEAWRLLHEWHCVTVLDRRPEEIPT